MTAILADEAPAVLCESCRRRPAVTVVEVDDVEAFAVCRDCAPVTVARILNRDTDDTDMAPGAAPDVPEGVIRLPFRLSEALWPSGVITGTVAAAVTGWVTSGPVGMLGWATGAAVVGIAADHLAGPR